MISKKKLRHLVIKSLKELNTIERACLYMRKARRHGASLILTSICINHFSKEYCCLWPKQRGAMLYRCGCCQYKTTKLSNLQMKWFPSLVKKNTSVEPYLHMFGIAWQLVVATYFCSSFSSIFTYSMHSFYMFWLEGGFLTVKSRIDESWSFIHNRWQQGQSYLLNVGFRSISFI